MKKLELCVTTHNMFAIQLSAESQEDKIIIQILKAIINNSIVDTQDYKHANNAGAFLQSFSDNFIM